MLKLISLYVIDRIFRESAMVKLSAKAQALYINMVIHYFRNKEALEENNTAFAVLKSQIPNYSNFSEEFTLLIKAGLVSDSHDRVTFNNVWSKYISKDLFGKTVELNSLPSMQKASYYKLQMQDKNTEMYELIRMKYSKLSEADIKKHLDIFIKEQDVFEKKYMSVTACVNHFINWLSKNVKVETEAPLKGKAGNILGLN